MADRLRGGGAGGGAGSGHDFETFFAMAPRMNRARGAITGVACGVRVEDVEEPLMREIRYLDELVDELARGSGWRGFCGRDECRRGIRNRDERGELGIVSMVTYLSDLASYAACRADWAARSVRHPRPDVLPIRA